MFRKNRDALIILGNHRIIPIRSTQQDMNIVLNYKHEYHDEDVVQNHLVQMHVVVVSDSFH